MSSILFQRSHLSNSCKHECAFIANVVKWNGHLGWFGWASMGEWKRNETNQSQCKKHTVRKFDLKCWQAFCASSQFHRSRINASTFASEIRCATNIPSRPPPARTPITNKWDNIATLVLNFRALLHIHQNYHSSFFRQQNHEFPPNGNSYARFEYLLCVVACVHGSVCVCLCVCMWMCRIRVFHSLLTIYSTKAFSIRSEPN